MNYGEERCEGEYGSGKKKGERCENLAYFKANEKYYCGVHSRKYENRETLKKIPKDLKEKNEDEAIMKEEEEIKLASYENKLKGKKGNVVVTKLKMMKRLDYIQGYLKVFPNYKHDKRKDGFGCKSLSPKSMGPINHGMKELPIAKNLENYHQFSKFFKDEVIDEKITEDAIDRRKNGFNDDVPHRNKFDVKELKKNVKNINIPLFSMYYDKNGEERRYTYIQARYFYCHWYERIATYDDNFKKLKKFMNDGYNLQIVGYDGFEPIKELMEHYIDDTRSFGHELVLYTMITVEDSKEYPWNKYYKENNDIYKDVI